MTDLRLFHAAESGNLWQVKDLVEEGVDKNQIGGDWDGTALCTAAHHNHLDVVRFLVEQGADIKKFDDEEWTPLIYASANGHLEVVRYLLEQGADRDKTNNRGLTPLHLAAEHTRLEVTKLLMVYGADLNARTVRGLLPIDYATDEEIEQAIRDEPRRRLDHGHKRATEQDRHPNSAISASAQEKDEEENDSQINKRQRLDKGAEAEEGKVAEEEEDSEPSDEEDDN